MRITRRDKRVLQQAAQARRRNLSDFLLESALDAADQALADRRLFVLDDRRWKTFQAALDRPVRRKPALRKLLSKTGVFD
ncbi:DUF1778 domain-containing protein [Candidatus Sumerlaeota bacterium]|nr:DUF1778 domain-containing protein [Candidatus Sumerlaeota bacterium]